MSYASLPVPLGLGLGLGLGVRASEASHLARAVLLVTHVGADREPDGRETGA